MKEGFYTAVGTPLDEYGGLMEDSFIRHIDEQIRAGASGVLVMGTMGNLGCIRNDVYEQITACASKAIDGRVRFMAGCSDNSLARVRERLKILEKYPVDVAVLTAPYYFKLSDQVLEEFFSQCAAMTALEIYLYDHLPITKHKITFPMMKRLAGIPNITGIKSGDLQLVKELHECGDIKDNFLPVFSGSDLFSVAQAYGIKNYLDGIFACFPKTISGIQKDLDSGNVFGARDKLNMMMSARDVMISLGIWPSFTCAMNLLGYEGNFAPDYEPKLDASDEQKVRELLAGCGELA